MRLALYQVNVERDSHGIIFRPLDYVLSTCNGVVSSKYYDCVFDGEIAVIETLEQVFTLFNLAHLKNYYERSLSVSDIVEVKKPKGESNFFYCNSIGFRKINFRKERY